MRSYSDRDGGHYRCEIYPAWQAGVPYRWGAIIHDYRSALDNLVWQLVILNGGEPARTRTAMRSSSMRGASRGRGGPARRGSSGPRGPHRRWLRTRRDRAHLVAFLTQDDAQRSDDLRLVVAD